MTNFPNQIDTDLELPPVFDNIVEIGEVAINAIRSAMFAVEETLGINPQGSMASVAARLDVSLNSDGTIKPSAIAGLGLVVLPITNGQISSTAAIDESKLNLIYSTQFLHNLISNLDSAVDVLNNFNSITGIKVEPHIAGSGFRHKLSHIDIDSGTLNRVNIVAGTTVPRIMTNAYNFAAELSNDLLAHTRADGVSNVTTPPVNMAHNASGISINPTNFVSVPQTANDLQSFAEFVDSSSLVLLGSRTQNLFENGIPRSTRNTSLVNDKAGEAVVDPTSAETFLLFGSATSPVDDIDHGDDVILLNPSAGVLATNNFDAQFAQVKPGDYITVNYGNGTVPVQFTIDSTKKFLNGSNRVYTVRINGKNLFASANATVRIDRPFYHDSKFNSLALAAAHNSFSEIPSLIVSNPNGAAALGMGFDPDKLDRTHYNLYLELYPTGNPAQKAILLPAIDVTGDAGNSTGSYDLHSVVENINNKFREPGYNLRFIAFAYQGQIGIALADRYGNTSFSIVAGTVDGYGNYTNASNSSFPGNVVDNYNLIDPLGFGIAQSNVASPPYALSYSAPASALQSPTVLFSPLRKSFYYVDGVERDGFSLEALTTKDGYGDGYWPATLISKQILSNRVAVTYQVDLDLTTSGLKKGKTLVVQPAVDVSSSGYSIVDYGRFIISDIAFDNCGCDGYTGTTTITVYDAVHGTGLSPYLSSLNIPVFLYFSDDSVSFNTEHVSDPQTNVSFKRFFEVYVDSNGDSFTHERARFNINGSNLTIDAINAFTLYSSSEMSNINLVDVSPKLRGFNFGQYRKLSLFFNSYDEDTGVFDGYICKFESPATYSRKGPTVVGKKGEVVRFYDDTTVDYIDIIIPRSQSLSSFTNKIIDIQLYPTLQLNQEKIVVGTCQLNDVSKRISYIQDKRQFGNISEKQLSTSALNYINAPQRLLDENGVIRGFDIVGSAILTNNNQITLRGGAALIDGKIIHFNDTTVAIPVVQEALFPSFSTTINTIEWFLCLNSSGEFEFVASTDYYPTPSNLSTYGSLDHNRLFYVKNPSSTSGLSYPIRSAYFRQLLTDYKDLLPLYRVSSTVGLNAGTWKVTSGLVYDFRRYIDRGYRGLTHTFTYGRSASFRAFESVDGWLDQLYERISYRLDKINTYGNTVYVRDTINMSGFDMDFEHMVNFVGDGGRFIIDSNGPLTLRNNVTISNLDLDVSSDVGIRIEGDNVIIDKCRINYTYDPVAEADVDFNASAPSNLEKACIHAVTSDADDSANAFKNVKITNCTFTTAALTHFPCIAIMLAGDSGYVEDLHIENNRFINTPTGEDKYVNIAVSALGTTVITDNIGPRLVNSRIYGNTFDKNQMIIMSAYPGSGNVIRNMIVPVNTVIEKNVCGSICFLVRQDIAINGANSNYIQNKDNMLIIKQNMCRYIFCGTNYGFINVSTSVNRIINDIVTGNNVYSGSVIINKNVCSWIQVGVKNPTTYAYETPMLEIDSNKLNAYDSTFLSTYCTGVVTPLNIALLVDSVVGT